MLYTCPCCGFKTFTEAPGSYDNCRVCNWEDDVSQLRFPTSLGTNRMSLVDAQKNYANFGSKNDDTHTHEPAINDEKDESWRPLDLSTDNIEKPKSGVNYSDSYPTDLTDLYYWKK